MTIHDGHAFFPRGLTLSLHAGLVQIFVSVAARALPMVSSNEEKTCRYLLHFSPMLSQMNHTPENQPLELKNHPIWNPETHLPMIIIFRFQPLIFPGVYMRALKFRPPSFAGTSWPFVASHTSFTWWFLFRHDEGGPFCREGGRFLVGKTS